MTVKKTNIKCPDGSEIYNEKRFQYHFQCISYQKKKIPWVCASHFIPHTLIIYVHTYLSTRIIIYVNSHNSQWCHYYLFCQRKSNITAVALLSRTRVTETKRWYIYSYIHSRTHPYANKSSESKMSVSSKFNSTSDIYVYVGIINWNEGMKIEIYFYHSVRNRYQLTTFQFPQKYLHATTMTSIFLLFHFILLRFVNKK